MTKISENKVYAQLIGPINGNGKRHSLEFLDMDFWVILGRCIFVRLMLTRCVLENVEHKRIRIIRLSLTCIHRAPGAMQPTFFGRGCVVRVVHLFYLR